MVECELRAVIWSRPGSPLTAVLCEGLLTPRRSYRSRRALVASPAGKVCLACVSAPRQRNWFLPSIIYWSKLCCFAIAGEIDREMTLGVSVIRWGEWHFFRGLEGEPRALHWIFQSQSAVIQRQGKNGGDVFNFLLCRNFLWVSRKLGRDLTLG